MRLARLVGLTLSATMLTPAQARPDAQTRPNIILIVTDDQGYRDVGFNGSTEIRTPNIDRIAREGVRFTRGYVTFPVCGPSRAGLLTGRYQSRFGFDRNPNGDPADVRGGLPRSEEMMSEMLKRGGYSTKLVGKWHMGTHPTLRPRNRGFDEFYGFIEGGHDYRPEATELEALEDSRKPYDWYRSKLIDNGTRVHFKKYLTEELSDRAVDFVARKADADQPFFLYLAYNAPHSPLQATEKYLSRYPDIKDPRRRTYAAMISAVDDGVGQLLDTLEKKGIAQDTVIFFLSDNGGVVTAETGETAVADNGPLRGGKSQLFEGGVRVPFAMRWPRKLPAGTTFERPVSSLDIFGTIASQTGIGAKPGRPIDGVDLVPYLKGEKAGDPQPVLYWRKFDQGQHAMVVGDLKYFYNGKTVQTFNLRTDQSETKPLDSIDPALLEKLKALYRNWNGQMAKQPAFPPLGTWPPKAGGPKAGAKAGQQDKQP
jgi:arylsulfatase A-like enzyme